MADVGAEWCMGGCRRRWDLSSPPSLLPPPPLFSCRQGLALTSHRRPPSPPPRPRRPGHLSLIRTRQEEGSSLLMELLHGSGRLVLWKYASSSRKKSLPLDFFSTTIRFQMSAALAIITLHGHHILKSTQRRSSNQGEIGLCKYLVGGYIWDAQVMWDNKTGHYRGYGFVLFHNQQACTTQIISLLHFAVALPF